MKKQETQSVGQLIAEKWFAYQEDKSISLQDGLAALINQEVEKVYGEQEKTLGSEIPVASEVVNAETGLAPCPERMEFALRALSEQCTPPSITEPKRRREWTGKIWCDYVKHLCDDALRETLIASRESKPSPSLKKQE